MAKNEELYRSMYRIRRVEEEIARIYPSDKIKSPVHLSIGQEAVSVGVCSALTPQDKVFGTYRCHAMYLAKGGDLRKMMAELFGKATGCAKGKGGSMHMIDTQAGVMGTSAVVATSIPNAVGYAYAQKLLGRDEVTVVFFGDGATEEGVFHESLNFAALKKLPILFVCENNFYAIHAPLTSRQAVDNIADRARSYGIPAQQVATGGLLAILEATRNNLAAIRRGEGPGFIECRVYRWKEHVGPGTDFHCGYRSENEASVWKADDQVVAAGLLLDDLTRARVEKTVEAEIRDAIDFAEASPLPAEAALHQDIYSGVDA